MTIKLFTGKYRPAERNRRIQLAMLNSLPRSYYVCEEVDLPHRVEFAVSINCVDLQIITVPTADRLMREGNPKFKFTIDPFVVTRNGELVSLARSPAERLSQPEPMNETSNPGGSA
jgi:hypothetical protein